MESPSTAALAPQQEHSLIPSTLRSETVEVSSLWLLLMLPGKLTSSKSGEKRKISQPLSLWDVYLNCLGHPARSCLLDLSLGGTFKTRKAVSSQRRKDFVERLRSNNSFIHVMQVILPKACEGVIHVRTGQKD